jgi:dTMP kinase
MYICLEGIDGSGKSTQIELLEKWLITMGYKTFKISEPTKSEIGGLIRKMLRSPNASEKTFQMTLALLFAADRMVLREKIQNAESEGKIVISDRCFYSSIVYQNDGDWIFQLNKHVKIPDLTILLDLEIETALERCEGKDHFENKVFLEKIRKKYLKLAEDKGFYVLNAENGVNKTLYDIKRIISPKLGICI